ncbi:uncharacterized protein LOC124119138 isoform X1 [Haliotis rufescens]|uniref:uncharacterized protein LOC124119138 isoform X1 n=2 Tax=Haliotis rufescens TaxID=6454 RepID=UPI00201F65D7|nr:uncharacterized protein LOC124119138 isoform X1 [Haliotis rufescens]
MSKTTCYRRRLDTEITFKYRFSFIRKASTMARFLMGFVLLLSPAAAHEWRNISATFGDTKMLLNVAIGDGFIELHSHKPENAPASFRETTNLHVFSRQLVAMRNSVDKECYVRHIKETFEDLKVKIGGIEQHNATVGQLAEDWIDVDNVCPIEPWAVKELLGDEIDSFCRFHDVYYVGLVHTGTVDLTAPPRRYKRAAPPRVSVASACCCCRH